MATRCASSHPNKECALAGVDSPVIWVDFRNANTSRSASLQLAQNRLLSPQWKTGGSSQLAEETVAFTWWVMWLVFPGKAGGGQAGRYRIQNQRSVL